MRKCILAGNKTSQRATKESQLEPKWSQRVTKGCKREPKEPQRDPKGSQRDPKGSQREPKGSPKGAKGSQKGAKREPNGVQNASKSRSKLDIRKRSPKSHQHDSKIDDFWSNFPSKIHVKINAKIDVEKVMKNDEKMMRKWIEI